MRTRWRVLAAIGPLLISELLAADDWKPPEPAATRKAFEAQYFKHSASAAALEIELLAAKLGIDAAPDARAESRPELAAMKAEESGLSAVSEWVTRELQNSSDSVGAPSGAAVTFLRDHSGTISALVAAAAGRRNVGWDLDVSKGAESPVPNFAGLQKLQKVLAAQVLSDLRDANREAALEGIEAIWRISRSLAARPELISQLTATPQARLAVGLLRKVRGPAYGWESRLREGQFLQALLAALQNDPWPAADDPAMAPEVETLIRIYRRFADGLIEKSPCAWTREDLKHSWDVAISGEADPNQIVLTISAESIIDMLMRSYRLLLDSELTALVVDARAERAASREDEWPTRLPNLESSVCPGRFYEYGRSGGMRLVFKGAAPQGEGPAMTLPLSFRGAPPPTRTPTPRRGTPTPTQLPRTDRP